MPLRSPFHFHWRPHVLPKEMRIFFVHLFSHKTAEALLVIAWPLALYEYGQRLPFTTGVFTGSMERGLLSVLLFYISARLVSLFLTKPLTAVFRFLGIARTMMLGQLFQVTSLLVFALVPAHPWLFFVAAAARGMGIFWYWVGNFSYFNSFIKPKYLGEEVGMLEFLGKLATVVAPLVSAFLVVRFGYTSVFVIGALLTAAAGTVLLLIPNFHATLDWGWGKLLAAFRRRDYQRIAIGMSGYAWEEIGLNLLWPVFLFVVFGRITTVGYILAGSSLLSLLLVYLTGVSLDSRKVRHGWQTLAGVGLGALWIPRTFLAQFPMLLVFTESIDRLLASFYGTLFTATLFSRAREEDIFIFYVNREVILSLTLITGFSLGIVLLFFGWNWSLVFLSFVAGALASLSLRSGKLTP